MDFTKFVSILENKCILFCRADLFDDKFEGSIPKGNLINKDQIYSNIPKEHRDNMINIMTEHRKKMKESTFISCWHLNEKESAAMWKLYAMTHESVAISTTYDKLVKTLSSDVYIGLVEYIDYETSTIPEGNTFWPFMFKRLSFKHESEVRAVIQTSEHQEHPVIPEPIDINELISEIYVSPNAPHWYFELIKSVAKTYGLSSPILQSSLSEEPIY